MKSRISKDDRINKRITKIKSLIKVWPYIPVYICKLFDCIESFNKDKMDCDTCFKM